MSGHEERVSFTREDVQRVRAAMERHIGPENAISIGELAWECGDMDDRKLRAILSTYDGVAFLLGENKRGRFIARTAEEAEASSAKLRARAATEMERCDRRDAYAMRMRVAPVEQLRLDVAS